MDRRRFEPLIDCGDGRLTWTHIESGDRRVRVVCGTRDLRDHGRVARLHEVINRAITAAATTVELDLRRVRQADTKLVGALVHALHLSQSRGIRFLVMPSEIVRSLFGLCRVESIMIDPADTTDVPRAG